MLVDDVDDNEVNQLIAGAMLDHWNIPYKCATNGEEVVDKWQRLKPDLILMDIYMPVCDGYKATKRIRELEMGTKRTTIIALSANDELTERIKNLNASMDGFINKPIEQDDFYSKLKKWLT